MDKTKPFIIEEYLESYTKKLAKIASEKNTPPKLNENASDVEKKFFESRVNRWTGDIANFIEPEVIPSIWQCEVVPNIVQMVKDCDCKIEEENLKIKDDGKSAYIVKLELPCTKTIYLCINDEGWSTLEDEENLVYWDGPSACKTMQDGLDTVNIMMAEDTE